MFGQYRLEVELLGVVLIVAFVVLVEMRVVVVLVVVSVSFSTWYLSH
jgi:hypothetical protein